MPEEVQTILVIDDHPLIRKGILQLIALENSLQLVGEAGDGQRGLALALRQRPDLILLDLNMRGLSGLETLKALKAADLDSRVIILTVSDSEEDVVAALRSGADGYLLKDMEPEEMLHSLKTAAQGRIALGERVSTILADALRHESQPRPADDVRLTDRERETLTLIA
ncbi:MAG TPA: response regulator, partial [Candidatus Competibacteraceae bacterium]|nr:response regulator [Candidatus Competibacteraceae bacterium]